METRRIEASGWPALALASVSQHAQDSANEQSWGVIIPAVGNRTIEGAWGRATPRVFPLRPLWQGFLLNTALYSTLWLSLLLALTTLRRATRRHRNLCPTCAYDLKGLPPHSPCPECGRSV